MELYFECDTSCRGPTRNEYIVHLGDLSSVTEVTDPELGFPRMYDKKGNLLILRSNSFGKGWSTGVRDENSRMMLMDARIIRFFYEKYIVSGAQGRLSHDESTVGYAPMREFLTSLGIKGESLNALRRLVIDGVPKGKPFMMVVCDGMESICLPNKIAWVAS